MPGREDGDLAARLAAEAEQIEESISSDTSPVGIDAKKTHVLILQKLLEIERRLDRIDRRLASRAPDQA